MDGYNHYIRVDQAGIIIYGFSSAFEHPDPGDILILEDGPRHHHAVFPAPLINEKGQPRFKWINSEMIEREQQELDVEWVSRPPEPPTTEQRLEAAEQALLAMMEAMT